MGLRTHVAVVIVVNNMVTSIPVLIVSFLGRQLGLFLK